MLIKAQEDAKRAGQHFNMGTPVSQWSPEVAALATIADKLSVLIEINKANPGQIVQYPRPITALDRVRHRRRQKAHEDMVAAVLPGR